MQNEDDFGREYTTLQQVKVLDAKFYELNLPVFSCNYWEGDTMLDCKEQAKYNDKNDGELIIYLNKPV